MNDASLILEGGGMRGAYTTGVIDFFLDEKIEFSSCYAVSAGACHCCSLLTKQHGRAYHIVTDYTKDKNYAGLYSLLTTGNFFGAKMIYEDIPERLYPLDYNEFNRYSGKFYVVATDMITGKAEYFRIRDLKKDITKIQASASLPFLSRNVIINGRPYLDGGMADAIPLKKSQQDGNKKNVVVLTRDVTYRKLPPDFKNLGKMRYRKYPNLVEKLNNRYLRYNVDLEYIEEQEKEGKVFVIRPEKPITIGRLERDVKKLKALYDEGYNDIKKRKDELYNYLNS